MLESKLRVSPHIDSHKFGAYEKDATAQQIVSTSGESSKTTNDCNGESTQTSSSTGQITPNISRLHSIYC